MIGHAKGLEISDGKYPFQRTDIQTFNIAQNSWIIGMVKSSAYSGDFNLNPFHFEHFDVSSIGFYKNGEPTPRASFKLDTGNSDYLQGLLILYCVMGKLNENNNIGISRNSYLEGYSLVGFDVDPTSSPDF